MLSKHKFELTLALATLVAGPVVGYLLTPWVPGMVATFDLWLNVNWPGLLLAGALWLLWRNCR